VTAVPTRICLFAFCFCLAGAVSASGQGTVIFANTSSTVIYTNQSYQVGARGLTAGSSNGFYYALLTAPAGTTNKDLSGDLWTFTGLYATNTATEGRLNGRARVTSTGWPADGTNSFMIAGWSADFGHDWPTVLAKIANYQAVSGFFGLSDIGTGIAGGGQYGAFPLFGTGPTPQGTPLTNGFDLGPALWGFVVLVYPTNQVVVQGEAATFTMAVMQFGPIDYQWYGPYGANFYWTSNTLTVPNAQLTDEGSYTVVARSGSGALLEEVPSLVVLTPPSLAVGLYDGGTHAGVTIKGNFGQTYSVQARSNLSSNSTWMTVTNISLTNGTSALWVDTSVNLKAGGDLQGYYRVMLVR
jgi:hypothetical protein